MINQQMELGFVGKQPLRPATRRQRRLQDATWWFSQMRQAVDRAFDWSATSPAPAEQTWLPRYRREARV